jgi:hypothetical protein
MKWHFHLADAQRVELRDDSGSEQSVIPNETFAGVSFDDMRDSISGVIEVEFKPDVTIPVAAAAVRRSAAPDPRRARASRPPRSG